MVFVMRATVVTNPVSTNTQLLKPQSYSCRSYFSSLCGEYIPMLLSFNHDFTDLL